MVAELSGIHYLPRSKSSRGQPAPAEVPLHLEAAMTRNEGTADRLFRLAVAVAAVLFSWRAGFGSVVGIILLVVAGIALVTATVGYCPTYQLFKFRTRPSPHRISTPGLRAAAHH
jgi:hypothetical protein